MLFEEKGDIITIENNDKCFVYFLLKEGEVVYVGQTTIGLARPFAHYDKEYDTVKALRCHRYYLDEMEDFYIRKYKPKYNKTRNYNVVCSLSRARNLIREDCDMPKYNLRKLRQVLSELNIVPFRDEYKNMECITFDQYCNVVDYIREKQKQ